MSVINSTTAKGCEGCSHTLDSPKQWCYMFATSPEQLPCTQHDQFAEQRKLMGKMILKNPSILKDMIANAQQGTTLS